MPKRKTGCLTRLMLWLNLLLLAATLLAFLAPYFPPDQFWPFIFIGLAFPVLALLNLIFLLFWLFQRRWYILISLFCLLASWDAIAKFLPTPLKSRPSVEGQEIVVATFNTQGSSIAKQDAYDDFNGLVLSWDADLVCMQEFNPHKNKNKTLLNAYPHQTQRWGQMILSKYPIIDSGDLELEKKKSPNGGHWADIQVGGKTIRVFNLHLNSNNITRQVADLKGQGLEGLEQWEKTRGILSQVKHATKKRSDQARAVARALKSSPHPVIVAGDFNDPPQSYTYHIISQGLEDAYAEAGKGLGFTYNGHIPFLKIDYTLASPSILPLSSQTALTPLSDHKPILTRFVLPVK